MPRRTIVPQRGKKSRLWDLKMRRKQREIKRETKRPPSPLADTGPSAGQGYSYPGWGGPWGGNKGGAVKSETEDQRTKRVEKEDANVRGYAGGGGVYIGDYVNRPGGPQIRGWKPPVPKRKERGYGQAQEGGTGFSGGGKVKSETEDQRSKKLEKEDANVRGYVHGGNVVGTYIKPYIPPVPKRKERGYGQAQEGGTGFSGGGKVKKYGGGGKVKKK